GRPGQPGHADQGSGSGEFVEPGGGSDPPEGWRPVVGPVGTLDLAGDPAAARPHLDRLRVFSGYAGWGPGQLAGELRLGGWLLADPRPDDAFSDHPDELWSAVLRRQRGSLAMLARFPLDLSQN
ncbi:MAG: YqgE/AlgH family protein, partial [Actinomycetes bacterium]